MKHKRKITLGISAAALAVGLGLGVTSMASAATPTTPSASSSAVTDKPDNNAVRGERGQLAADLAAKLGVDQAKVTAALKTFRDANKPAGKPAKGTKPDHAAMDAAMAKSLATTLGIDETKVSTALTDIHAAEQVKRTAVLKTKLDKSVAAGTLTQAEADAVTKAVEKGVIGGGGR
ncbi:hypothetical protein ACQCSX_22035 (plasmid) [Pseudarthrobacter sp. P1]|uniref:hypothetical protein n=1 Tax=Pseudarthrobacter sp. P1 TaxID=3418418 RepID=UPI003CEF7B01